LKVAVVAPAPTLTDPGTLNSELLLASVTVAPPVALRVTVQALVPPCPTELGLQLNPLTVNDAATETVPPVALTGMPTAIDEAAMAFATPIVVMPGVVDIVAVTVAIMPLEIIPLFIPLARQL
jgi:hypothetical protein